MSQIQEKNKKKWSKDGRSWYFACYYNNIYGERKQKKSKLYFTKKEAKEAEIEFLKALNKEIDISDPYFIDVYNEWFEYKKSKLKSTSYYSLRKRLDKHVLAYFEKYKLHSINVNNLNLWKKELHSLGNSLDHENKIIGSFKEILDYSVTEYDFNPKVANKLYKYRLESSQRKSSAENNYWTSEEFNDFINNVDDEYYKLMFEFLYYTGLRISEMIALNWNDVELKNKKLNIDKTFSNKCFDENFIITDPKTKNSIRIIDLDSDLIDKLKIYYEHEKKIYGFSNQMFLFGNARHTSYTTFKNKLDYYINISKCKKITPHGFRHSHASLLWDLGCSIEEIAKRLGDTPRVVEETYAHIFPKKVSHTINVLEDFKKN
ncbi:MAG: site-specific integrase [Clostridia bacterium]|nr:site-specific integrase [Clostridia bacterium]